MAKILMTISLALIVSSCDLFCAGTECSVPPPSFKLELLDADTGEDLFLTGVLDSTSIQVRNSINESLYLDFSSWKSRRIFTIYELQIGPAYYTVTIEPDLEFRIDADVVEKHNKCCTSYQTNYFDIEEYEYNKSTSTDIYTVLIN